MNKIGKKNTLDSLALMVSKGFENTATKADITRLEQRVGILEQGQEEIKLKLDNVAYRFSAKGGSAFGGEL